MMVIMLKMVVVQKLTVMIPMIQLIRELNGTYMVMALTMTVTVRLMKTHLSVML